MSDRSKNRSASSPSGPPATSLPASRAFPAQSLHWTDTQFCEALDASPDCIVGVDHDFRFIFANQPAMNLLQTPGLIGQNIFTLFPGNLEEPFHSSYRTTNEKRVVTEFEAYHGAPLHCWFRVIARPVSAGMMIFFSDVTARKTAELTRDEAARQLQQVFDTTTDAIIKLDRTWRITFLNRRARELLAVKGDLVGKNMWEEFPASADPANGYAIPYHRTMNERVVSEFEAFYPAPLDRFYAIESRPAEDGGVVLFFRDITERRAAEQAIRSQQDLLDLVQQAARMATWELDFATGVITYGTGAYPVYGHPLERVSSLNDIVRILAPGHRPRIAQALQNALRKRTMLVVDFQVIAGDGAPLWIESRAQVIGEPGALARLGGMSIDITARKHEQEITERQRAEVETIYETAAIGLALFSPGDFRYLRINSRQAEIIGLPASQIVGRTLTEIAPGIPGLETIFRGVAAGHPVRDLIIEGELPSHPGERRAWNVSYTPVYGSDGVVQAITAASLEITTQKKTEAALIQSEKLAAVGRLASSISHEINNPLEGITNLLYLIATASSLPEDLKAYVHMAQAELSRVSQIATQTLRFHRQAVKPTLVTPADLVDAVLSLYHGRLANSGIRIDAQYASETRILCFENDIRQVLNNLIANAIDAMRTGGRLIARAHDAHDPVTGKPGVRITVADTGHGMSESTRSRVFEPFYTTKDLNGNGLGLWISAGIVQRHHGNLSVRSSEHPVHHGTVFTLFLPIEESPTPNHPAERP